MYNSQPRPLKIAGADLFYSLKLELVCMLALILCSVSCLASIDLLDLVSPGNPTDVLAAGLVLPSQFAMQPDITRPISLLEYPASATIDAQSSSPLHQNGAEYRHLISSSLYTTINYRGRIKNATTALAGMYGQSGLHFNESGSENGNFKITQDIPGFGAAASWSKTRLGVSLTESRNNLNFTSTKLSGIETVPGSGIGYIASAPKQKVGTTELAQDFGTYLVGILASRSTGNLDLQTIVNKQGYSALSETSSCRLAPYLIHKQRYSMNMLLLDTYNQCLDGPVLIGKISAGSWNIRSRSSSIALAHLAELKKGRKLYSLQYSTMDMSLYGQAGGFFLPGLFDSIYTTKNGIKLNQITARYGVEKYRGKTTARWSIMLAHCNPGAYTHSTKAEWLHPLRVLSDSTLPNTSAWVLAPSIGGGYTKGNLHIDAGLSVYGGILFSEKSKKYIKPKTEYQKKTKTTTQPGYQWGLTIRRVF